MGNAEVLANDLAHEVPPLSTLLAVHYETADRERRVTSRGEQVDVCGQPFGRGGWDRRPRGSGKTHLAMTFDIEGDQGTPGVGPGDGFG